MYSYFIIVNINIYNSICVSRMSQSQLCENCKKGNHHSMQYIENCNCNCSNTVVDQGNPT